MHSPAAMGPRTGAAAGYRSDAGSTPAASTIYLYDPVFPSDLPLTRARPVRTGALADLFCSAGDCVVTRNTSRLEPGIIERKYYTKGIGVFLETNLSG